MAEIRKVSFQDSSGNIYYLETSTDQVFDEEGNNLGDILTLMKDDLDEHKADFEYQIPVIVGTQIRINKQSNTNRLYFKLNNDLVGNITISLDNGVTSIPLQDFEGVQLTELEKGFVEVVESLTNFTLRSSGENLKFHDDLPKYVDQLFQGEIHAFDDEYIYSIEPISGNEKRLNKISKESMKVVASSNMFAINGIVVDDSFLYVYVGTPSGRILKLNKSNLALVDTIIHGSVSQYMHIIDGHIYSGRGDVIKIRTSDLSVVGQSAVFSNYQHMSSFGDYLYVGSAFGATPIKKINTSTLTLVAQSVGQGQANNLLATKDSVYVGIIHQLHSFNTSNLTADKLIDIGTTAGKSIIKLEDLLYVSSNGFTILDIPDLNILYDFRGGGNSSLHLHEENLYMTGYVSKAPEGYRISKHNLFAKPYYKSKEKILFPLRGGE